MLARRLTILALLGACVLRGTAVSIPAGTQLSIRLTTPVNTADAHVKQPVKAVLIVPVFAAGALALPSGSIVSGQVKEVKAPADQHDQAVLTIQFESIQDPAGGHKTTLSAKIVEVDNARETVDQDGRVIGIDASKTASGRLDQGINKLTERYPGLGELLGATKAAVVKEADPNITYDAGIEMTIELTKPLAWTGKPGSLNVNPVEPERGLAELVDRQPFRTMAASPPRPSDLTNLIFIGSRETLERAFQEAGWSTAAQLNEASKLETFRAIVELRGYKEAPVSTLLLDGIPPDMVFQKQNNTFAQRHHLRIWRRPGQFNGKDIWVCAATHDIGIDLSRDNRTFIHKVDPDTDKERAKVVADLLYTGLVKGLSLVDRPGIPLNGTNATGDPFTTDGKIAVVEF